jgi:hypothetical protein
MSDALTRPPGPAPLLVATDLRKSYGPTAALAGASVTVRAGEILAVMGPSGSGKPNPRIWHGKLGTCWPSDRPRLGRKRRLAAGPKAGVAESP